MGIIIRTPNIKQRAKWLKTGVRPTMNKAGFKTILFLRLQWSAGKGGNEKSMKRLSKAYKKKKTESGRKGIPDMNFEGNMTQGLTIIQKEEDTVEVTFREPERKKAAGNQARRSNMFVLSRKHKDTILKFVLSKIQGK